MPEISILFVCLGNICRSPTAEGVFRALAQREAPELSVRVDSAGTADYHIGEPPDARTQAAALRRGYDLSDLRARMIEPVDFTRFDLLLAMDRSNLRTLEAHARRADRHKLRLLLEFAPGAPVKEVPDPYYGGPAAFDEVLDLAELGARGLIDHLRSLK